MHLTRSFFYAPCLTLPSTSICQDLVPSPFLTCFTEFIPCHASLQHSYTGLDVTLAATWFSVGDVEQDEFFI